jgi:hypothetical protein
LFRIPQRNEQTRSTARSFLSQVLKLKPEFLGCFEQMIRMPSNDFILKVRAQKKMDSPQKTLRGFWSVIPIWPSLFSHEKP